MGGLVSGVVVVVVVEREVSLLTMYEAQGP